MKLVLFLAAIEQIFLGRVFKGIEFDPFSKNMDNYSYISNINPVYKLYKWILICFCVFLTLQSCIVSKKEAKNNKQELNYYTPTKTWSKALASLGLCLCLHKQGRGY